MMRALADGLRLAAAEEDRSLTANGSDAPAECGSPARVQVPTRTRLRSSRSNDLMACLSFYGRRTRIETTIRLAAMVLGLTALMYPQGVLAHESAWPAKRLSTVWPEAAKFTSKQVALGASQVAKLTGDSIRLSLADKTPTFYFAQVRDQDTGKFATAGVIIFIDESGANGLMEISVGVTPAGQVAKINIWQHSEDERVAQAAFLDQFIDEKRSDSLEQRRVVQPVKGAEVASQAVARAVRRALAIINAVYGKPSVSKPDER
jgi:Na+-translocating ferredoxin:NAD+ oxidoreductase RnfG subunit